MADLASRLMRFDEFEIGRRFYTATGAWLCTDKGQRVIVAVPLHIRPHGTTEFVRHEDDPSWWTGPPYKVAECVFDEYAIEGCAPTAAEWEREFGEKPQNL